MLRFVRMAKTHVLSEELPAKDEGITQGSLDGLLNHVLRGFPVAQLQLRKPEHIRAKFAFGRE